MIEKNTEQVKYAIFHFVDLRLRLLFPFNASFVLVLRVVSLNELVE